MANDRMRDVRAAREVAPSDAGVLARILEPPATVATEEHKIARIRATLVLTGVVVFGLSAGLLAVLGFIVPMLWAATGAAGYAALLGLLRRGYHRRAADLALVLAFALIGLFTFAFGLKAGVLLNLFGLAALPFLVYGESERLTRLAVVVAATAATAVLGIVAQRVPPLVALDPGQLLILLYLNVASTLGVIVGMVSTFARITARAEAALQRERALSENLLLNVLPGAIAERLKRAPGTIADSYPAVTVLFADIVGFTPLSARIGSRELVEILNQIFSRFDRLAETHGLEKIKTIGDAYMAVGGLPLAVPDHAARVAGMALDMLDAVAEYNRTCDGSLAIRIGVHSGPVVAGVIGEKKFSYDLWGDTVNTASRLESHGEPGRVHVSGEVREALGDVYRFEDRGLVVIKGKGPLRTWYLDRPSP